MGGPLVLVLVMLVVGPVLVFATGAGWSALLGSALDGAGRLEGEKAGGPAS